MTPTMEEVAGWLREAQEEINNLVVFSGNYPSEKQVFNDRAAQVEAMGCSRRSNHTLCGTGGWTDGISLSSGRTRERRI